MSATIYLEGGGDSKELQARCREGFRKLLDGCAYKGRMPKLVSCGGRDAVCRDFRLKHESETAGDFVAMWIDSEEPMADIERSWAHLKTVKTVTKWDRPAGATDGQVLLMTTCMETWIVADRATLKAHFGPLLQDKTLPKLHHLETRHRHKVQRELAKATRKCSNPYAKGKASFEILGKLKPSALKKHLPSFVRVIRILDAHL